MMTNLDAIIRNALCEDLGKGDVTTRSLIPAKQKATATIIAQQDAVVCGLEVAKKVFWHLDKNAKVSYLVKDGQKIKGNARVLIVKGSARTLLTGERVALNFLSYLSAIATRTKAFVDAVKPCKVQILDTRKTTPTLRFLERYAVRCGGGYNHRDDLSAMAMIKDNHWLCIGDRSIQDAVRQLRTETNVAIEVEVDTLRQFHDALESGADVILLDNMPLTHIQKAVKLRDKLKKNILLEVSGGISLDNIKRYAKTGVDRISVGTLTHSREAIDFSMEIIP